MSGVASSAEVPSMRGWLTTTMGKHSPGWESISQNYNNDDRPDVKAADLPTANGCQLRFLRETRLCLRRPRSLTIRKFGCEESPSIRQRL